MLCLGSAALCVCAMLEGPAVQRPRPRAQSQAQAPARRPSSPSEGPAVQRPNSNSNSNSSPERPPQARPGLQRPGGAGATGPTATVSEGVAPPLAPHLVHAPAGVVDSTPSEPLDVPRPLVRRPVAVGLLSLGSVLVGGATIGALVPCGGRPCGGTTRGGAVVGGLLFGGGGIMLIATVVLIVDGRARTRTTEQRRSAWTGTGLLLRF